MGRKAGKVFLLFLACANAQMFPVLTYCTLPEVKLFSAPGTRFHLSTCICFAALEYALFQINRTRSNFP